MAQGGRGAREGPTVGIFWSPMLLRRPMRLSRLFSSGGSLRSFGSEGRVA